MLPEPSIGPDEIWDTFGGIKAGNLNDVLAEGVLELGHATAVTFNIVVVVFKAPRPRVLFLVQTIEPFGGLANLIIKRTAKPLTSL